MKDLKTISQQLQSIPEEIPPMDRLIQILRTALSFYPMLKESFFSEDPLVKKESTQVVRWLVDKIEDETVVVARQEKIPVGQVLTRIYGSDKISPEECQKFLQARALLMEYADEIFTNNKPEKKQTKNIKVRI